MVKIYVGGLWVIKEDGVPTEKESFINAQEKKFVSALQRKEVWAFERLYDQYSNIVGGIAKSYLNVDDVEDIVQEVFFRVYKGAKKFRGNSTFSTWLYRITVNACKDMLKKYKRRSEKLVDFEEEEQSLQFETQPVEQDIESKMDIDLEIEQFREALSQLSEEDRLYITLRDIEELDYQQISEIVEKPLGTVKSRIHYARKRIQSIAKGMQ